MSSNIMSKKFFSHLDISKGLGNFATVTIIPPVQPFLKEPEVKRCELLLKWLLGEKCVDKYLKQKKLVENISLHLEMMKQPKDLKWIELCVLHLALDGIV